MLVMKTKLLALVIVVFPALGLPAAADGYTLTGMEYDHTAITYSCGDPVVAEAVRMWADVSALTDGGCSANPDILMTFPGTWEHGGAIGWAAYTSTQGHTIIQCTIGIRSDAVGSIGVYLHEVGHCLGSSHSLEPNVAMSPYCCSWLKPDDIAMIQSIYGNPEPLTIRYRAFVPMVAQ